MSIGTLLAPQHLSRRSRLSTLLRHVSRGGAPGRITIGELMDTIGNRAFGVLMFVFAAPIALPIPVPGISAILGVPLLLLTWQLMVGRRHPLLPASIRRRSFDRRDFSRLVDRIVPWLERVEQMIGPRHLWLTEPAGERLIGSFGFALSIALFVPVPFGNMLPALALALLALGILERDGRVILAGGLVGMVGTLLLSGIAYGLVASALFMIGNALGW